jgi:hypothetical protein
MAHHPGGDPQPMAHHPGGDPHLVATTWVASTHRPPTTPAATSRHQPTSRTASSHQRPRTHQPPATDSPPSQRAGRADGAGGWGRARPAAPDPGRGPPQPLEVGRTSRAVQPAQHIALAGRDGRWVPDCARPWAGVRPSSGALAGWRPTDLATLALLGRAHHRAVHEGGWRLQRHSDGRLTPVPPYRRRRAAAWPAEEHPRCRGQRNTPRCRGLAVEGPASHAAPHVPAVRGLRAATATTQPTSTRTLDPCCRRRGPGASGVFGGVLGFEVVEIGLERHGLSVRQLRRCALRLPGLRSAFPCPW